MNLIFPLIPYHFAYLVGSLYFLAIWLFFFWRFPRHRRSMIVFGLVFSWLGIFAQYVWWTRDWWHPITLFGTRVGMEDFLTTITHISVPSILAKYFLAKDAPVFECNQKRNKLAWWRFFWGFVVTMPVVAVLFFALHWNSFFSTGVGIILAGIYIWMQRPDLGRLMVTSATLSVLVAMPMYLLGNIFSPGVIDALWDPGISGIRIIGIPAEDLAWYFIFGFMVGGMYEYLFGYRLIDLEGESFWDDARKVIGWLEVKVKSFSR